MTAHYPTLSILIPVYNNAGSLRVLHARLVTALRSIGVSYEIIYANDGSTDGSYAVLAALHAGDKHVKVIDLAGNFGQSAAILAAIGVASGDIVVTIDADLQNHPEDIGALVAAIRTGADLACGVRLHRHGLSFMRKTASNVANRLVGGALGINLQDWGCGLNAATAELLDEILAERPLPALPKVEAALRARRIAQVAIGHSERIDGHSAYNLRRLSRFSANFLHEFSARRSFLRLVGMATGRISTVIVGPTDTSSGTPGVGCFVTAAISWALLAVASTLVRLGTFVVGRSASAHDPCQIHEIRE
jgi:undecaprenyl-phosphate 4-deoxy-4-formamido-L-arabinose transferase